MRIGIDARMYGLEHAGIGRYVENLVQNLLKIDKNNQYVLFVRKAQSNQIKNEKINLPAGKAGIKNDPEKFASQINGAGNLKLKIVIAEARHYSIKEQFLVPYLIWKEKVNLMHFPHFNVPVFYFGKYVVTIHDLIKHTFKGMATTTRNPLFYWFKYFGYLIVFWLAVKRAKKILVPSKTVALQLRKAYSLPESKVVVTYEGVDKKLQITNYKLQITNILEKYDIKKPYLLYVGSVYPHKNISNLIRSILVFNSKYHDTVHGNYLRLVVVCSRNAFWERLRKDINELNAQNFVNLAGFIPDEELVILYRQAEAFVFPSESEGFGLPGLEAMASGLPVLASDIPVFREVYQDAAFYFDQKNPEDIAQKIKKFLFDENLREQTRTKGLELVKNYSWSKMAQKTLKIYKCINI